MNPQTAIMLLTPAEGRSLRESVDAEVARLTASAAGTGNTVRVAYLLDDGMDLGGEWTGAVELAGDVGWLLDQVDGLESRLGGEVDVDRSAAVVGSDRLFFDRSADFSGPRVKMYYALFLRDDLTLEEFDRKWREEHAPLVEASPYQLTYHQLCADVELSTELCARAGLGIADVVGIAHEEFPDQGALAAAAVDEDLADERDHVWTFADMNRSRGILTYVEGSS